MDDKIIFNIATFLGKVKNDSKLLSHGIWLIKHIRVNQEINQILLDYKIIDFLGEIYERHLLDKDFMRNLIIIIANFINIQLNINQNTSNIKLYFEPIIRIIQTQLRPNLPSNLLRDYIHYLYKLTNFHSNEIYYKMIDCKLHKEFINFYPLIIEKINELNMKIKEYESNYNNGMNISINNDELKTLQNNVENYSQICMLILKILGKLMYLEDGIITQILIDNGISKFLNFALETSSNIRIIKNVFFCISNICASSYGQISDLFNNNTIVKAINIGKNIYEALNSCSNCESVYYKTLVDAFREVNFVFSLSIINLIKEKFIPLAIHDNFIVVMILIKGLNMFAEKECSDLTYCIFKALYTLSLYDDLDKKVRFIEIMEKNGVKEYIDKLIKNKNLNYVNYKDTVEKLYEAFSNDFQIDNNL